MLEKSGSFVNLFRIIDDLVDLRFGMNDPLDSVFTDIMGRCVYVRKPYYLLIEYHPA